MKIRAFLRQLLGNTVTCPWCDERLDDCLKTIRWISPVAITILHARYCKNYYGRIKTSYEVWSPQRYSLGHYTNLIEDGPIKRPYVDAVKFELTSDELVYSGIVYGKHHKKMETAA